MLHHAAIDALTQELLKKIMFAGEYADGGIALALPIGHRKSIDHDFFGKADFDQINI
jgi:hypothetical protein